MIFQYNDVMNPCHQSLSNLHLRQHNLGESGQTVQLKFHCQTYFYTDGFSCNQTRSEPCPAESIQSRLITPSSNTSENGRIFHLTIFIDNKLQKYLPLDPLSAC